MSEIVTNQPKMTARAFGYFVLSFCLLVPTIGTLAFFLLLDHFSNERLAIGSVAGVYLSSVILGLFSAKRFWKYYGRAEFWALVIGVTVSAVSCLVATGALILSYVAAGLHIQ